MKKKMKIGLSTLYKLRDYSDGITFFDFKINLDLYEDDHKPYFEIQLTVLNFMIFHFEIYNMYHLED